MIFEILGVHQVLIILIRPDIVLKKKEKKVLISEDQSLIFQQKNVFYHHRKTNIWKLVADPSAPPMKFFFHVNLWTPFKFKIG